MHNDDSDPPPEPEDNPLPLSPQEIAERIAASIAGLPAQEQQTAIHSLIGGLLKQMPVDAIRQMREEIVSQFAEGLNLPIVSSTLDLIDGALVLRELGQDEQEPWR